MVYYQQNIEKSDQVLAGLKRRINILSLSRLGVILLGAALLFQIARAESVWGVVLVFFVTLFAFAGLVYRQSMLERQRKRWDAFLEINQNEIRIREGQANRYDHGTDYVDPAHPYTQDLDIFGEHSLYALLNRSASGQGKERLAAWLRSAADPGEILRRQEAIRELATDKDWIQQFQVDLFPLREDSRDLKSLMEHYVGGSDADGSALAFGNTFLRNYVRVAPFLLLICFAISFWYPIAGRGGIYLMIIHLLAALWSGGKTSRIAGRMDRAGALLGTFSGAVSRIAGRDWQSRMGMILVRQLNEATRDRQAFTRLARILERFDYRLNMLVGALLNMTLLWDFRQIFALQDWQKQYGGRITEAVDVVGGFEALSSLAILHLNHPGWAFPEIQDSTGPMPQSTDTASQDESSTTKVLDFTGMAHPLIPAGQAVANSYSKADHRIALVTGSNMAGKSTFLRTAGINMVLAYCGGPVCAAQMQVSVMHLVTYMRIKDSLQESTSTFKAELDRMRMILDTVRSRPDTYFLIDEMLRGTNSVDKYRGSKAIIERLIGDGASGMVATHDLQLAGLESDWPAVVRNFHFDIQVREGEMHFDYRLKTGACTVFNASMLLRGIGIEVGSPDSPAHLGPADSGDSPNPADSSSTAR